jgi:hypothetical protein
MGVKLSDMKGGTWTEGDENGVLRKADMLKKMGWSGHAV